MRESTIFFHLALIAGAFNFPYVKPPPSLDNYPPSMTNGVTSVKFPSSVKAFFCVTLLEHFMLTNKF